jgi:hypothetical protein
LLKEKTTGDRANFRLPASKPHHKKHGHRKIIPNTERNTLALTIITEWF